MNNNKLYLCLERFKAPVTHNKDALGIPKGAVGEVWGGDPWPSLELLKKNWHENEGQGGSTVMLR